MTVLTSAAIPVVGVEFSNLVFFATTIERNCFMVPKRCAHRPSASVSTLSRRPAAYSVKNGAFLCSMCDTCSDSFLAHLEPHDVSLGGPVTFHRNGTVPLRHKL